MKTVDTYFYAPPSNIDNDLIFFPEDELIHISRVLRLSENDTIVVVDGEGNAYETELIVKKGQLAGKIIGKLEIKNETETALYLGLPLIKPSHLEIAIDMSVQLGIRGLWIFKPDRLSSEWDSERVSKLSERIRRIMVASMKQSKRAYLPEIIPYGSLDDILKFRKLFDGIFFGHPFGIPSLGGDLLIKGGSYLLIVGPEGDFSARELEFLEEIRGIPVSLGPRRLRTETASIALVLKVLNYLREI